MQKNQQNYCTVPVEVNGARTLWITAREKAKKKTYFDYERSTADDTEEA